MAGPGGEAFHVGQVFDYDAGNGVKHVVLLDNSQLAFVSATQAQLLEFEAGSAVTISPAETSGQLSGTPISGSGLPAQVPTITSMTSPLCIVCGQGLGRQITSGGSIPSGAAATGAVGGMQVDQVWLPPDHGALVGALGSTPDGGSPGLATAYFLLTGAARYALSAQEVAPVLGYSLADQATVLPASVLDLVPQGSAMAPAAATQQAQP